MVRIVLSIFTPSIVVAIILFFKKVFWNGTKGKVRKRKGWKMHCFIIMTEFKRESGGT